MVEELCGGDGAAAWRFGEACFVEFLFLSKGELNFFLFFLIFEG